MLLQIVLLLVLHAAGSYCISIKMFFKFSELVNVVANKYLNKLLLFSEAQETSTYEDSHINGVT